MSIGETVGQFEALAEERQFGSQLNIQNRPIDKF